MIEQVVLRYLNESLKETQAYMEVPKDKEEKYVIIEKTGSGVEEHIQSAIFAIQSVADSLLHAAELNEEVKSAMRSICELDEICRAELNSDYNYTDISTKEYRYQAVYDITYYEEE